MKKLRPNSLSFAIITLIVFTIFSSGCINDDEETTKTFNSEVYIAEGGHFKYTAGYFWDEIEIILNITLKEGTSFDVYIMDEDQYENAYDNSNTSILAFSTLYAKENITKLDDTIHINEHDNELYIVMDNRNTTITPNDATPTGTIILDVKIKITSKYYFD